MQTNLGRVQGSRWYTGTDIEGHSTTPTVYETDIDYARVDDLYLNTSNGNVFACVTAGDPDTAEWVYDCNIAGPTPDLVDNLHTDSATKALTARQGKVLNDKILSSGIFPDNVDIDVSDTAYMAQITIRNIDGTLTFTTDSGTGTYTFTKIGTADTYTVTVDIGEDIGLAEEGAVVTNIAFDDNIYSITLKDDNADTIYSEEYKVWDGLNNALAQVKPGAYITDGTNTVRTGFIQKAINGIRNLIYPVTHAKAVFMDFGRTTTVYDLLDKTVETRVLAAASWSNGVYDLSSVYPNNEYDIQVTPCTLTTSAQLKAWSIARPIGSASANTITCLGTTPTIDITVMVVATKKGGS